MPRRPAHLASTEGGRNPAKPHTQSEEGRAGRGALFRAEITQSRGYPEASGAARPPRAHRTAEDAARHPSATCPPHRHRRTEGRRRGRRRRRAAGNSSSARLLSWKKGRGKPAGASPPLPPRHAARALAQQSHGCALPPTSPPSPSVRSMGRRRARKRGAPTKLSARPLRDCGGQRAQPAPRTRPQHASHGKMTGGVAIGRRSRPWKVLRKAAKAYRSGRSGTRDVRRVLYACSFATNPEPEPVPF